MIEFAYSICVAMFVLHELDAVQRREWRVFPLMRVLPDPKGYIVFVLTHLPLLCLIFWFGFYSSTTVEFKFRLLFGLFSIVHIGLHKWFESHPAYEFKNPFSKLLIWGWGISGAVLLALMLL